MKKIFFLIMLLLFFTLVGCDTFLNLNLPLDKNDPQLTPEIKVSILPSKIVVSTFSPTVTKTSYKINTLTIPITPTKISTPTPRNLPFRSFEQNCLEIKDSIPEGFLSEGAILFKKEEYQHQSFYQLTSQNSLLSVLPDIQKGSADGVSPDGRWLAFGGTIKNIKGLFILGPSGEIQTVFPWQDKWNGVQSWLDSERLIMIFTKKEPIAVDLLNPFIGDVRTLNPGLDDVFVFGIESPGPNSWYIWKLVYDPSLSRLVYLRDNGNLNELSMVMIDLNSKETIWEFESPEGADLNIPVWSPNGEKLLFVSKSVVGDPFQLFTIDKNGVEIKWIHLQHDPGVASEWHWSPDSQHIAFFSNTSLYVLDIQTKQLVDFCIPYRTGFSDPIKGIFQNIYWSPDSSQILFQRYDAPAIVIDLETLVAVPIVESTQFKPIGWIKGEN